MKNLEIKKRIERRKAKSRRAIQAFWLAKAKEAHKWCLNADELLQDVYDDAENMTPYGFECCKEEAFRRVDEAQACLTNALCRYQQAIPKGGAH